MVRCLLSALLLLGLASCESDPSKDSGTPPIDTPVRPSCCNAPELHLTATLDGDHATGVSIREGAWSSVGPGQDISLTFRGAGMQGIGQFDLHLEADPAISFDMASSLFTATAPFVTILTGVEQLDNGRIRVIGADLTRATHGDADLGTLRLRTPTSFTRQQSVRLRVVYFSIGPTSTERDTYDADDLLLGITVNGS